MKKPALLVIVILMALAAALLLGSTQSNAAGCDPQVIDQQGVSHPLSWLQAKYPGLRCIPAASYSGDYFKLETIGYKSDPSANFAIWVKDQSGQPVPFQPTTYWFPDPQSPSSALPTISPLYIQRCSPRGVLNKNTTDGGGFVSYQLGSESWMSGGRGPYGAQVLSVSTPSECYDGFGWDPYTEHQGYVYLFFRLVRGAPPTVTPTATDSVTPTGTPGVTPTPIVTVTPVPGDLAETNRILRAIYGALIDGFRLPTPTAYP